MKRSLVLLEDFVNSELMDHLGTPVRFMLGLINQACQLAPSIKNRIYMHHHTYVFPCILPCSRYWPILRDGASSRCSGAANTQSTISLKKSASINRAAPATYTYCKRQA